MIFRLMLFMLACLLSSFFQSALAIEIIKVKTDFLELHTGAGRGFPVVNVLEQGEVFTLVQRKYDWLKVQTSYGDQGWVSYEDFLAASHLKRSNYRKRGARAKWQLGTSAGLLQSDPFYSGFLNYFLKPQFAVGGEVGQMAGSFSSSQFYSINGKLSFFRDSLLSPVMVIGIGTLDYRPRESLLNAGDNQYGFYKLGFGALYVPYKRFAVELLINNLTVTNLNSVWGGSVTASVFYD